eukprot:6023830-Pleurochrysis_carterae.AAC.1
MTSFVLQFGERNERGSQLEDVFALCDPSMSSSRTISPWRSQVRSPCEDKFPWQCQNRPTSTAWQNINVQLVVVLRNCSTLLSVTEQVLLCVSLRPQ